MLIIYMSQSIILLGYLMFFISRFRKNKKSILMVDVLSRICFIMGYWLIGSINSIEHTIYAIVRNIIGSLLIAEKKSYKILGFGVMLLILFIMYGLSFNGISTVMFVLSGIINLYAIIFTKEQGIRLGTIFASFCNIIAFSLIGNVISVIGELLCGIIGFISYLQWHSYNTNKTY